MDDEQPRFSVKDEARKVWFKHYPVGQTLAAFALAVFAVCAFSIAPFDVDSADVFKIDPSATGAYYIALEVLLSFAGHYDAIALLALACLLTFPFRYVFFGRGDSWRPSVVIPAAVFAALVVVGYSYDVTNSAELVLSGISRVIEALIQAAGWYLLGHIGIYLVFECLDWLGWHRIDFSEARMGRIRRAADLVLERHPLLGPAALLALAWSPTLVASLPGLFMGDTGAQIRQWFNLPNGTSDYLNLIDPNVLLNAHHPVVHTALIGSCVQLGLLVFGSANAGVMVYTLLQFGVTVACVAYMMATLWRMGAGMVARLTVLAFFVFMPLFSNYAVLLTKDVLFADFLLLMAVQTAKLLVPRVRARRVTGECTAKAGAACERCESGATGEAESLGGIGAVAAAEVADALKMDEAAPPAEGTVPSLPDVEVPYTAWDWVLLAVASFGTAFFRNGGIVLSAAALLLTAFVLLIDRHHARGVYPAIEAPARGRVVAPVAIFAATLAVSLWFTGVFMPAHGITPASKREALSIPFQMTARFVQKHDGAHSGVEDGTDDGLVTDEEREIIDRVLDYSTLGSRYNPNKSDAVKNAYNEDATAEELSAYFRVWAEMFWKDPESYVSAFVNNYYGYFYPSESDAWTYSPAESKKIIERKENQVEPFDFHAIESPVTTFCARLVNIYRVAIQRIPLLSLSMSSATYVWLMLLSTIYLLRARQWRSLALWVPLWGVLAVCLVGPCNGATYMRYIYPVILIAPFVAAVTLTWPRPLRSRRR